MKIANLEAMKVFFILLLTALFTGINAQETTIVDGFPKDLDSEKIIFLKHEPMQITANPKESKEEKYVYMRQKNHNKVIDESNKKLVVAALDYPFSYAFGTQSTYMDLAKSGYKYVLISQVYKNDHLKKHPDEDILIVFEYFILDMEKNLAYKAFEMDEMKVYDSKMMIRRLMKEVKRNYPDLD